MPYYRGDYVGGKSNYYRGDPFLGAIIGSAARSIGLGGLAAKAGRWVAGRITGSAVKKAAIGTAAGAALPVLMGGVSRATGTQPIQLGPLGIDPGSMFPGGEPGITWGRRRSRRMNPLNPKALRRALRRAEAFEKFAKRTVNALHSGPKKFKSTKARSR